MTESFDKFGTVAFDLDYMKDMIRYGEVVENPVGGGIGIDSRANPTKLNLAIWMSFVPKVYREDVARLVEEIGQKYLMEHASEATRLRFIGELRGRIFHEIRPR